MLSNKNIVTTVGHFKDAAERHYQTCTILVKKLSELENDTNKRDNILANIYYLSGYMTECAVKYWCLTDVLKYEDAHNYLDNKGTKWKTLDIKTHLCFITKNNKNASEKLLASLTNIELPKYLLKLSGESITLEQNEELLKEMQEKWDPNVRYAYESTGLIFHENTSKNDILAFYTANKNFLRLLAIIS